MGLRICVAICITSFLLGILFTHWIADSLTLWKSPITNDNLWIAASYYSVFARSAPELGYILACIVTLGATALLWSLGDGAAWNIMFDGGSIFLYGTAVAVYLLQVLPDFTETFTTISTTPPATDQLFSPVLKAQVLNLASANLICSVALTGVMALQAARWWAESSDPEKETEDLQTEEGKQQQQPEKDTKRRRGVSAAGQIGSPTSGKDGSRKRDK